mgnify:CR=1 FL=1
MAQKSYLILKNKTKREREREREREKASFRVVPVLGSKTPKAI